MSTDSFKIKKSLHIEPQTSPSLSDAGDIGYNSTSNKLEVRDNSATRSMVSEDGTQTLTNKSISGSSNTFSNIPSSAVNTGAATTVDIATSNSNSTVNIGTGTGTNVVNIGGADTTVNITGTVNNNAVTNLNVSDKLITINDGGGAASGFSSGIEVEENGVSTGYIQTSTDRNSWQLLAPNSAGIATLTPGASNTNVVLDSAAQVITNKDIDGGTASNSRRITLPKDTKANLDALTRKEGTIVYSTDLTKAYIDNGTNLVAVGSGSGGSKNYLTDGDAEATNSWVMYDDASVIPVDGISGTTSATVTVSSTNPLTGIKSYIFTPHSALGEGAAYTFTLDREDRYKTLNCELSLEVNSGSYIDGDLTVYLYDVTNSTLIYASPVSGIKNSTINNKQVFSFNATSSTSYRLLIHQATTNSGYTMKFEAKLGPSSHLGYSPISTDWASYTPTISAGFGSVTGVSFFYKRNGKMLDVSGSFVTGTCTAALGTFTLPSGLTIDSAALPLANTSAGDGPIVGTLTTVGANQHTPIVTATSTSTLLVYMGNNFTNSASLVPTNPSVNLSNNADTVVEFSVPISGWSSDSKVLSEYDGRAVALIAQGDPASAASGATIIWPTVVKDTLGAYNPTTGEYTVKVAGIYKVHGGMETNGTGGERVHIYKNGSSYSVVGNLNSNGGTGYSGLVECAVNDVITVRIVAATRDVSANSSLNIELISGAQQISAGERIIAIASGAPNSSYTADTPIVFSTMAQNTHGSYNVSTGEFTAARNDFYKVDFFIDSNIAGNTKFYLSVNGSKVKVIGAASTASFGQGAGSIYLATGQVLTLRAAAGWSALGAATEHSFAITSGAF
jgi:hypothetical protein